MNSLPAIFQFLSDMVSQFHDMLNQTLGHLIGNPVFDALSTISVTLHTLSEDAKTALEELRKEYRIEKQDSNGNDLEAFTEESNYYKI